MLAITLIITALATCGLAAPTIPTAIKKRAAGDVYTSCTVPGTAALTFDDGPHIYVQDVVDALNAANATATWFFNGNNYGCIYSEESAARVKYVYDHGHHVASHTWSHSHLNTLNWDQLHHQFWLVEEALMKITGTYPAFVRPPYGEYNDLVREVARVRGQALALWDFDSGDSAGITLAASKARYDQVAIDLPSSLLALNHDTLEPTAHQIVPYAITVLQAAGYRLVSLAECLGQPAYQWVGAPQARDSTWHC